MLKSLIVAAAVSGIVVLANSALAGQVSEAAAKPNTLSAEPTRPVFINQNDRAKIRASVETFVWGLSHKQAAPVWALAAEVLQKYLKNEQKALGFFSKAHPQLADARALKFDGVRMIGKMPVAGYYVKDAKGRQWYALFAVTGREDGAFQIAFCKIHAAPGVLI